MAPEAEPFIGEGNPLIDKLKEVMKSKGLLKNNHLEGQWGPPSDWGAPGPRADIRSH